ncbi:MAG: LysE family translocator [Gammaproteobacteria bacterium]
MLIFLKGLIIGFAIAAPVGPIGLLCIQRSLHHGFKIGLLTGLGAALADGCYGVIAGFGLTAVSTFLIQHKLIIQMLGGLFLIFLGGKLFVSQIASSDEKQDAEKSSWHAFLSTYFLTLSNPATILSFIAIFAGLGLGSTHTNYVHAVLLVLGVILGSSTWWLLLSGGVAFVLHHRLSENSIKYINYLSGVIIMLLGLMVLLRI